MNLLRALLADVDRLCERALGGRPRAPRRHRPQLAVPTTVCGACARMWQLELLPMWCPEGCWS